MAEQPAVTRRSIDRKSVALLLLVCAVCIFDVYSHMSHPAYREYRRVSSLLEDRCSDFERRVKEEFVPAILSVASNRVCAAVSTNLLVAPSGVVLPSSSTPLPPSPSSLSGASYFAIGGVPYIRYNGFDFTLGDFFIDEPIVTITPAAFSTSSGRVFLISPFPQFTNGGGKECQSRKSLMSCPASARLWASRLGFSSGILLAGGSDNVPPFLGLVCCSFCRPCPGRHH